MEVRPDMDVGLYPCLYQGWTMHVESFHVLVAMSFFAILALVGQIMLRARD